MTKKLWIANVTVDIVVFAETEDEAADLVEDHLEEEVSNQTMSSRSPDLKALTRLEELPKDWRGSLPYGGDGERTCRAILEGKP